MGELPALGDRFRCVHCTVGDLMIAASSLIAAILVGRSWSWPRGDWKQVAVLTIIFGLSYTAYSEWFIRLCSSSVGLLGLHADGADRWYRIGCLTASAVLIVPIVALASVRLAVPSKAA